MTQRLHALLALLLVGTLVSACAQTDASRSDGSASTSNAPATGNASAGGATGAADVPSLAEAYEEAFLIGAALNPGQFTGSDAQGQGLVEKHFNSVTPENVMKWEEIHPEPEAYDFEMADAYVAFGEENDMFTVGHTLVWHSQTPDWVFENPDGTPVSRDTLIERMRDHIYTVAGRYEGRIDGWDVVNEALNDDGTLRESPWLKIIGPEYLPMAFRFAREAAPEAELYYNDYSLEVADKRDGAVRLVRRLQDEGAPITGIGTQAHHRLGMDAPSLDAQVATIEAFAALGIDVMVTELDIAVLPRPQGQWGADISQSAELRAELNPYPEAFPDSMQQQLAERYRSLFDVFLDYQDDISRVTFWGVTDRDSWLNGWPIAGRTSYPLLFDRQYAPKPAFEAVVGAARRRAGGR